MEVDANFEMLDKIFNAREEEISINDDKIKEKLNNVTLEELQSSIDKTIIDAEAKNKITKQLELLIENYEIKMANYLEQGYKQGFKDAFDLIMDCLR